jgi:hypothetical protein
VVTGLGEVHTRPWVDQWRTHTDFHAAYCGGELRYPGEGHQARIANLKSGEFLKRQRNTGKPTDSHGGVEWLHLFRRRLAAIRLGTGGNIEEKVPGETDHHSPIVILRDVNQKIHIVKFRVHKLELVSLPHAGVRPHNQNIKATLNLPDGGEKGVGSSRELHGDNAGLKILHGEPQHCSHADDQNPDHTQSE